MQLMLPPAALSAMKIPQLSLPFACLMALSGQAAAADWWFVPAEPDQDRSAAVYVEKSSMLRIRGTGRVTARVWKFYRTDQTADFGAYRSGKIRVTLDCEKKEAGSDSGTYYSAFGGAVHQYRNPQPEVAPIEPKSLQDIMATFMCSDGKKPPRALPVYDPSRDAEQRFLQYDRDRPAKRDAEHAE